MPTLLTLGHGTLGRDGLVPLLRGADVATVVDVRRFPGSRRNPDVSSEAMTGWLPESGVEYRWEPRLGGRRRLPKDDDTDRWWQVQAFRAYAAHMRTDDFRAAMAELVDGLLDGLDRARTAVMCSESVWWRCHRRMISDAAVLLHGIDVLHLGHDGRLSSHRPAAGARVTPDGLVYDRG
jgi:uncharacterized protein (DUF488 family)